MREAELLRYRIFTCFIGGFKSKRGQSERSFYNGANSKFTLFY